MTTNDSYSVLQLRIPGDTHYERFVSLRELKQMGLEPKLSNYEVVYTAPLPEYFTRESLLEYLYMKFNSDYPAGYQGRSMSVSDIVAVKEDGGVTCYYVDSIGFEELPAFSKQLQEANFTGGINCFANRRMQMMTETRPCKCGNDFEDFGLMCDGLDYTAWTTIYRDYQNTVGCESGAERYYLRLGTSGYDGQEMQKVEIYYCPWCGRKLGKDS